MAEKQLFRLRVRHNDGSIMEYFVHEWTIQGNWMILFYEQESDNPLSPLPIKSVVAILRDVASVDMIYEQ